MNLNNYKVFLFIFFFLLSFLIKIHLCKRWEQKLYKINSFDYFQEASRQVASYCCCCCYLAILKMENEFADYAITFLFKNSVFFLRESIILFKQPGMVIT